MIRIRSFKATRAHNHYSTRIGRNGILFISFQPICECWEHCFGLKSSSQGFDFLTDMSSSWHHEHFWFQLCTWSTYGSQTPWGVWKRPDTARASEPIYTNTQNWYLQNFADIGMYSVRISKGRSKQRYNPLYRIVKTLFISFQPIWSFRPFG
jgi:hypothetical protein